MQKRNIENSGKKIFENPSRPSFIKEGGNSLYPPFAKEGGVNKIPSFSNRGFVKYKKGRIGNKNTEKNLLKIIGIL